MATDAATKELEVKIISAKTMIKLGCKVLPVRPDEVPNIHKAIKDPDQFERYVRARPGSVYVVATGSVSGVLVVSLKGAQGTANFQKMVETNSRVPATPVVCRGGDADLYFLMPNARVPNCEIAEGVEVHGDGGFVPGPGNKHPNGQMDVPVPGFFPGQVNIQPTPKWLLKKIYLTAEIVRLAQLSVFEYERERNVAAERLKCRVTVLDELVQRTRNAATKGDSSKDDVWVCEPKLWPTPVDGVNMLKGLTSAVLRYVVVPKHVAQAIALWIVHTYALLAFGITPRLAIKSPLKNCGKSTLLDILSCLVCRPLATANITTAALFRIVDATSPTLLIDEADTFLINNNEIRGILNSGHRRSSAHVIRVEGKNLEPREFATFAPAAIAAIGSLPDTLEDRSIQVNLKRRRADENIELLDLNKVDHLTELASKAARWVSDHLEDLKQAKPQVPVTLANREADNWRPLFAVADTAGGGWPVRIRRIAEAMTASARNHEVSVKVLLLRDIRAAFADSNIDRMSSATLVKILTEMEGHLWGEWRGTQPLTQHALARLLYVFNIYPGELRIGEQVLRGYKVKQFADAFGRYLGDS